MGIRERSNPKTFDVRNEANDIVAPFSFSRKQATTMDDYQRGVAVEVAGARFIENGAGTYDFDVLLPADALITGIFVYAEALWDAATSASLEVGDYNIDGTTARDADGFLTAVDLKATDLTLDQTVSLLGGGQGGVAGAYNSGTNTHWDKLWSDNARILRFRVVSVGAGTAGRTRVYVAYAHLSSETLITVTQ